MALTALQIQSTKPGANSAALVLTVLVVAGCAPPVSGGSRSSRGGNRDAGSAQNPDAGTDAGQVRHDAATGRPDRGHPIQDAGFPEPDAGSSCDSDRHGDEAVSAYLILDSRRVEAAIDCEGDVDVFRFRPTQSQRYRIATQGGTDTVCTLLSIGEESIAENDDGGEGANCMIEAMLQARTSYLISVRGFMPSETGDYSLLAEPVAAACGNSEVERGEECDDGNRINSDDCLNTCVEASCGDGVHRRDLHPSEPDYEECDDGNDSDDDECSSDCISLGCGNGRLNDGEACDDGNIEEADACRNDCTLAACGDGVVRRDLEDDEPGYEACDDGNNRDGDGCSRSCQTEGGNNDCPGDRHGNSIDRAFSVSDSSRTSAGIDCNGDNDYFRFAATRTGSYAIETSGGTDTYCYLMRSDGQQIASDDDGGSGTNCRIMANLDARGVYVVRIRGFSNSTRGSYTAIIRR